MIIYILNRVIVGDGYYADDVEEITKSKNKESIEKLYSMIDEVIINGYLEIKELNTDEIDDIVSSERMEEILEDFVDTDEDC